MALEKQLARLEERANRFRELHEKVKKKVDSWPSLLQFERCVGAMAETFSNALPKRLALIQDVAKHWPQVAAGPAHSLEKAGDRLLTVLSPLTQQTSSIPLELVEFTAWCFERVGRQGAPFAVAIDDKVAMLTLREIAEQASLDILFPEFFAVLENRDIGQFVVLLLPEKLLERGSSLNWSVIAHEVGHAYLEHSELISDKFPEIPTSWAPLRRLAGTDDDTGRKARHLLQLTEYASDEIAVRLTGSAFAWRLLAGGFVNLEQVSSTSTHPQIDKRVGRAAQLSKELGFSSDAAGIEKELYNDTRESEIQTTEDDVPEQELESISQALKRAIPAVSAGSLTQVCNEHNPPFTPTQAREQLRLGHPIALDPWAILCLATLDPEINASEKLQEVLADSIRLGQVRSKFRQVIGSEIS